MKQKKSIGIFDSGFGGLNVMKTIAKELPDYDYVYLGDTARVPYGTRSAETIYAFVREALDFLFQKNCELVVFACNSASSDALRRVQREYVPKKWPGKKVLGVLVPAAEEAARVTKNKKVGVIATSATVNSKSFEKEIKKVDPKIKIFQKACPLLVPIVEYGEHNSEIVDVVLEKYLRPLKSKNIDTLILGCTHYGLLEKKIKKIINGEVKMISEPKVVAKKLRNYLERHPEIEKKLTKNKKRLFFSTDLTDSFQKLGSCFFGEKIKVERAEL